MVLRNRLPSQELWVAQAEAILASRHACPNAMTADVFGVFLSRRGVVACVMKNIENVCLFLIISFHFTNLEEFDELGLLT